MCNYSLSFLPPSLPPSLPLSSAARKGHLPVVEFLLDKKPSIIFDKTLRTALHYAAEAGHVDVVRCLVQRQPRLLEFDESQEGSSLHLASRNGHLDVVQLFLGLASLSEGERPPCKPRNEGLEDSVSLDRSVDEHSMEECINVLSQSPKDSKTPLHEAAINGHVEVVKAFVDHLQQFRPRKRLQYHSPQGPSPSISPCPTPIHSPAPLTPTTSRGVLRTPTSSYTGIDLMTTRGMTPLHEAARRGHKEIVEILLDAGADINAIMRPAIDITVNAELTALVEAGMSNKIDMVRFLLQKGATDARQKALHRVIRPAYNDIAGVLLSHNGAVTVDSGCMELKKRKGDTEAASTLLLSVGWGGKKLPYLHPSWLDAVLVEAPRPKADHCAISQLILSENKLCELPLSVFQLPLLHHLDISRNEISTLPVAETKSDGGWDCSYLEYVDLSKNQLSSIPAVLLKLPQLKELNVNYNQLKEVPIDVWLSPKLQKLYLQHNLLSSFPSPLSRRDSGISTWEPSKEDGSEMQIATSFSPSSLHDVTTSLSTSFFVPHSARSAVTSVIRRKNTDQLLQRRNRLQTSPLHEILMDSVGGERRRVSIPIASNLHGRLLDMFPENPLEPSVFEDDDEYSPTVGGKEKEEQFSLEVLDLSFNMFTEIPDGLCCLAPLLQKLLIHHNLLQSLGSISDYPADVELLDASNNQLTTAIAFALNRDSLRSLPCAQKVLLTQRKDSLNTTFFSCSHRNHSILKKLSYLRLNHNRLKDLQLFQEKWWKRNSDFSGSVDETNLRKRTQSYGDRQRVDVTRQGLHKSAIEAMHFNQFSPDRHRSLKDSIGEESSDESSSDSSGRQATQELSRQTFCIFPGLSSLDISYNKLRSVPANLHKVTSLSVLVLSYNTEIDTLPLELSNLENLWSLEYKGVPLVSPSADDLDKFHSAVDKLQFMRSLLHK